MNVDQVSTERAAERADRAARIVGRSDVVESEQMFLEFSALSQLMSTANDDGRQLDLVEVADAWTAELEAPGAIADFVGSYRGDPDIEAVGVQLASRYVVTVAIAAVLDDSVRTELFAHFAKSTALVDFEAWLRSGSSGAEVVRASLLQLPR